jgi:ABC-2 type transport system permease protein
MLSENKISFLTGPDMNNAGQIISMKLRSIISRYLREQWRSFWILLLTISMGPFFMFVYYLILESSEPHYRVTLLNDDRGCAAGHDTINKGEELYLFFGHNVKDSGKTPFSVKKADDMASALAALRNKKTDVLVIVPENFSEKLSSDAAVGSKEPVEIRFSGDLTSFSYILGALWANEALHSFIRNTNGAEDFIKISETGIGVSSTISEFDMIVSGILILSIIMLMFTATIAFVSEVENRTIIRLKLSRVRPVEIVTGISIVQLIVGTVSVLLTLVTAASLGFKFHGSYLVFLLISILTSLSIIAFSLIIAAFTSTTNQVLVVGNFPLFLFMFFTGAAFPLRSEGFFSISGYPVSLQGLMSPTHAISALNKIVIMQMGIGEIIPELIALVSLTVIYFLIGMVLFRKRHLRLG